MNKKMEEKLLITLIGGSIMMILILTFFAGSYKIEKGKAEYYRDMMLNFCEINKVQVMILDYHNITEVEGIKIPEMNEPCEYWELSY